MYHDLYLLSQDLKMENYVEIGLLKASDCLIMCKYLARRANPCRNKREPDRAVSLHLIFKRNWGFAVVRVSYRPISKLNCFQFVIDQSKI